MILGEEGSDFLVGGNPEAPFPPPVSPADPAPDFCDGGPDIDTAQDCETTVNIP